MWAVLPDPTTMWSVVLYTLAVVVGLILFMCYEPKDEKETDIDEETAVKIRPRKPDFRLSSLFNVLGISIDNEEEKVFEAFTEHFHSLEEISEACRKAGLEKSSLIIGVDFTASNEWQGRKSFSGNCLHKTSGNKVYNPYQKVIWILGQALAPFADEDLIPAYGFGDSVTCDEDVFSFLDDEMPCHGFLEVLDHYTDIVKGITLGGPTSFSPIIAKAIEIVKQTRKYHILVVIADGQVTEETPTIDAIVEASKHPISIIVVGIGDGPWDIMEEFDHRLPKRRFDNFRFVNYHKATLKAKNPDTAFALQTLMEIPDQYKRIKKLGYLGDVSEGPEGRGDTASGGGSTPPHCSPRGSPKRGVSGRGSPSPHSSISGRGSPAAGTPHSSPTGSPRHQPYVNGHSTTSPRHRVIPDRITTSV